MTVRITSPFPLIWFCHFLFWRGPENYSDAQIAMICTIRLEVLFIELSRDTTEVRWVLVCYIRFTLVGLGLLCAHGKLPRVCVQDLPEGPYKVEDPERHEPSIAGKSQYSLVLASGSLGSLTQRVQVPNYKTSTRNHSYNS